MTDETLIPEAQRTPYFSGWRPAIGWISVLGLSLQFVVFPILNVVLQLLKFAVTIPMIDTTAILAMITTTVGLGGMRTWEKLKGVASK